MTMKNWAKTIKRDAITLWLAARDPRTPWVVKALAAAVAAYALSPIDLIPDFIPVLGYLDDLIIVPLGILAVVALVPPELLAELRAKAAAMAERPVNRVTAAIFILIWIAAIGFTGYLGWRHFTAEAPQ
ncbi:MAG: YkvA family protein [Rhodospirillaceae bacterium]